MRAFKSNPDVRKLQEQAIFLCHFCETLVQLQLSIIPKEAEGRKTAIDLMEIVVTTIKRAKEEIYE